jgi:hypothetical protein
MVSVSKPADWLVVLVQILVRNKYCITQIYISFDGILVTRIIVEALDNSDILKP